MIQVILKLIFTTQLLLCIELDLVLLASLTNVESGPQFAEVCQAVSESSAPILIEFEWYRKML